MLTYSIVMFAAGILIIAVSYLFRRKQPVSPYLVRVTEDIPEMNVRKGQKGTVISVTDEKYLVEIEANDHDSIYALIEPSKLSYVRR